MRCAIIELMNVLLGAVLAGLFGLMIGSFAGATVWRLRARQLAGEEHDLKTLVAKQKTSEGLTDDEAAYLKELKQTKAERMKELKPLQPTIRSISRDRSQCLHCHHELSAADLIPLASWLRTGGKCRYCKKPIGRFEPIIELASATLFVLFYLYWLSLAGVSWWLLAIFVPVLCMLIILFAYDAKWFLLPDVVMFPLIGLASVLAVYNILQATEPIQAGLSTLGSVAILSGLYFVLWFVSQAKGGWVGFGDVKLGLALGLLLADWKLAFLTLFLANFIGTLIVLPGLITKKVGRKTHIPFGPLLIVGFFIALFYGSSLIEAYLQLSTSLSNMMFML